MKLLRWIVLTPVLLLLGIVVIINISPYPFIYWFRHQPDPGPAQAPDHYEEYEALVEVRRDLVYPSKYKSNTLDIYYPKDDKGKNPTLLWAHGGAFVVGDKSGTEYWCTMMASRGYTVVSINYEVAPEAKYPAPIIQFGEAYEYLNTLAPEFPSLDLDRLVVGGDSAGAQIASQFLALQTNPELSRSMGIAPVVSKDQLKAAVLYCGPYNVKRLADVKGRMENFFLKQIGWAYLGERKWRDGVKAEQASTVNHVTGDYPPVFITDGNTGSFEKHGRELEEALKSQGVPVTSLFYPLDHGVVYHEYQFKLDSAEAKECFDQTLSFLAEHVED
ncbi:hypothetical protein AMS62_10295 [Bacillus sp. FJAT-18019]|nr:hypothetical protein AMS62_10295 [Bacillus sp. FJAT-18019]